MMRRLIGTASLSAVSAMASRGALFAGVLAAAHYLGPAAFGQFTLIQTTALLFTTFCALSLGQMATKIVAEAVARGDGGRVSAALTVSYGSALLASLVFAALLLACAYPLAVRLGGSADLAVVYASSSLLVLTGFVGAIQNGVALALHKVKQQAAANLLTAPVVFAIMWAAATRRDIGWAMYGAIAAQWLIVIGQERVLRRYRREHAEPLAWSKTTREDWAVVWRLGLPSSLSGLLTMPAIWLSMAMLAHSARGDAELGHFALGNQARSILLFGMGVVANAALPMLSAAIVRGAREEAASTLRQSIALLVVVTACLAGVLGMAAPLAVARFAPAYAEAVVPLQWLLLSAVATAPTTILMRKATADGRPAVMLLGNAAFAASLIGAAALALKLGAGATGVAIAYAVASTVQLVVFATCNRRELRWPAAAGKSP
ncbi:Membrane protein involved in the export of O-antigen and teichoic acid [Lysobacter sp. yr284]|uniref:oligosaccharide flippase family protein n=1 Tax=Lysobacter sp. yr284 TaxID=1761791 RepID=UPI0008987982|nr:oligosaccharide flippase family protein [Lysobacter sp. yr284]SDY52539.1 Membrane protein involved in the export of O-antigen and teichoic acid [Lysobacter sp. yr284]